MNGLLAFTLLGLVVAANAVSPIVDVYGGHGKDCYKVTQLPVSASLTYKVTSYWQHRIALQLCKLKLYVTLSHSGLPRV